MSSVPRPPLAVVISETVYNLAYAAAAVALVAMAFPGVRYRMQRAAAELAYDIRVAGWRARRELRRQPVPRWVRQLPELPDEPS